MGCTVVMTRAGGTTAGNVSGGRLCAFSSFGGGIGVIVVDVSTRGLAIEGEGCIGGFEKLVLLVGSIL